MQAFQQKLMFIRMLLVGTLLLPALLAHGQKRNFNWVMASKAWLQFSADTMVSLPMADTVSLRNACISDTNAQFLLLADDFGIRNALFETVPGGSAEDLGWSVPAGNYLVLPMPGNPDRYAVFINELPPNARAGMVEVDLTANSGSGAVIGGTTWYMENTTTKLSATTDASDQGYWVLQHGDSDDSFHAYHLTATGLDPSPVVSHGGTGYLSSTASTYDMDRMGKMNFNFQGDVLAAIKNGPSVDTSKVELFHFDRAAGQVQFWSDIRLNEFIQQNPLSGLISLLGPRLLSVDFDRTGRYFYLAHGFTPDSTVATFQYDLWHDPDSLTYSANFIIGNTCGAPQRYDVQYGTLLATAPSPNNTMIFRLPHDFNVDPFPAPYAPIYLIQLPESPGGSGFVPAEAFNLINTWPLGGLPYPCKRYSDDLPLGVSPATQLALSVIDLRPNPMTDRAALVFNGTARPEIVIWRDALGRVVQRSAVGQIGPTYTLEREGLPAGLYMVEVLGSKGTLGVVKVLCE